MVEQLVEKDSILDTPYMRRERMWRLEGEQEGELKGNRKVLSRLLEKRFGTLPNWATEKLENATIEELEQWSLRILDVESLEQVFE